MSVRVTSRSLDSGLLAVELHLSMGPLPVPGRREASPPLSSARHARVLPRSAVGGVGLPKPAYSFSGPVNCLGPVCAGGRCSARDIANAMIGAPAGGLHSMTAKEVKLIALSGAQPLLDVSEYCRRAGICEAEERRLLLLLGRQASCHELQMNIVERRMRAR